MLTFSTLSIVLAAQLAAAPASDSLSIDIVPDVALDADSPQQAALPAMAGSPMAQTGQPLTREMVVGDTGQLMGDVMAAKKSTAVVQKAAAAEEEEVGFFETHFPFSLDEDLHPDIDANVAPLWIVYLLAGGYAGPIWLHKVLLDDPTIVDEDYQNEALWFWIWQIVLTGANVAFMFAGAIVFGVGMFITMPVGLIILMIRSFYTDPVSYINFLNRHTKGGGKKKRTAKAIADLPQKGYVMGY